MPAHNRASEFEPTHGAAVALYVAHYNLCRVHKTLRITPAMALGLTDHIWSVAELVNAVARDSAIAPEPSKRYGRFTVMDGGR